MFNVFKAMFKPAAAAIKQRKELLQCGGGEGISLQTADGGYPMSIEIAKAVNGYIVKGHMYNPTGQDFNEFRVVPDGEDLIEAITAVLTVMRMK